MKITTILTFLLFFWLGISNITLSQNPIWTLSNSFIDYNQPPPVLPQPLPIGPDLTFDYQGQPAEFASNAYHNPVSGKLLFFVVDGKVFDHEGYFIGEMIAKSGLSSAVCTGSEEIAIFPDPGNCSRYYILSSAKLKSMASGSSAWGSMSTGTISLLDLSIENEFHYGRKGAMINLVNPLGGWGSPNSLTTGQINETELFCYPILAQTKLAVSPLREDNSRLAFYSTSGRVHAFRIDESGISSWDGDEMLFNIEQPGVPPSLLVNDDETIRIRGEMELIRLTNGNYRIAVPYIHTGEIGEVQLNSSHYEGVPGDPNIVAVENQKIAIYLAELDSDGLQIISQKRILFDTDPPSDISFADFSRAPYIHGLEFSPDGNILYVTHSRTQLYPNPIWYYNFSSPQLNMQDFSITTSQTKDFARSQIEAAEDGAIYMANNNRMARISNPNTPNNPGWVNNVLSISNQPTHLGNFPSGGTNPNELPAVLALAYKSYSLPDQSDLDPNCKIGCYTISCGTPSTDEQCCRFFSEYDSYSDVIVSTTTTWSPGAQSNPFGSVNGEVYFSGNIIVEPGVVLTLEGMTLHFSPTSKVIVSRAASTSGVGAKLVAKNSILTVDDRCGACSMWSGVEVYGYPTAAQSFPHQIGAIHNSPNGSIHVIANSKIEHALRGILVGRTSGPNNFIDSQYSGGMVGVDQSTFFNNEVDVQFAPYTQLNRSFFNRSTFITDGLLNDLTRTPWFHLGLFGVDNINIKGCTFVNETPTVYAANQQGIGIASINSRFFVDAFCGILTNCPNPIRSVFHDLTDGVIAMGFPNSMPFTVDRSDFLNNHTGIYASNVNNFRIQRNVFEVYKSVAPNFTFETRGIHILNSTGYIVQENNLYESTQSGISGQGETVGVLVDNSGTADNEIYKNSFRNLKVGGKSLHINSEPYPFSNYPNNQGLRWKCNNFAQDMYQADLGVASGRIAYQQGYCLPLGHPLAARTPAGNSFSQSTNTSANDFWANPGVLPFNYAHHADAVMIPTSYTASIVMPQHCSPNGDVFSTAQSCPTRIRTGVIGGPIGPIGAIIGGLRSEILALEQSIEDKEERLNEGSSAALLNMIANTAISHGDRKNALIAASPLLSDEVLVAYVLSTPPAGHLAQVISANSPVSPTVWSEIEALSIPRGIKRQLESLQQGVSERTYLVNELGYEKTERSVLVNELLATYWMDTTLTDAKENIKLILENEHTGAELHRTMVEYYLKIHAIDQAQSSIDAYIALAGYDEFVKLAQYAIASSPVNCLFKGVKEDSQQRDEIKDIADNMPESRYCSSAQTLLEYALNESYERYTEPLIMSMSMMQQLNSNTAENNITTDENVVQIFPNPASSEFFVVLDLPSEDLNTVTVDLYTLTGQKVNSVNTTDRLQLINMDVSHLSEGMYLVIVTVGGEELSRQKVAVK